MEELMEMLNCFDFLSKHFSKSNIRTMDRGFDCNKYYEYFIKNKEKFIIRAKKNRNVIYKGKTINILKLANTFKGKYKLEYKDKSGINRSVKISIIPIRLCEFKNTELNLVVVHGFGKMPMMLITNLKSDDKRICTAITHIIIIRILRVMQDYSINELIEKISADTIIIPKSVAFRKDVYEESKTLFGVVFTECVNDLRSYGSFIDGKTVGKMMKEYVMDMTIPDIQCECLCSPTMASAARSETVMLINKTNLLECLRESQVI